MAGRSHMTATSQWCSVEISSTQGETKGEKNINRVNIIVTNVFNKMNSKVYKFYRVDMIRDLNTEKLLDVLFH